MIPLEPVQSSNIAAVGYDTANQVLAVKFSNGTVYHFKDVPADVIEAMKESESKGSFFSKAIRGKYESEKIEVDE
jgi:hypothetical protein